MENYNRVIVLAPHTDDGEFGCGASIVKLIEKKSEVIYIAFSIAEESLEEGLPKNILETEVRHATKELGIKKDNLIIHKFPVRKFSEYRQEILEEMVKINNEYKPEMVFLPASTDTHQDHNVIYNEGFRAFKKTSMLGYEIPWNNLTFTTNAFCDVDEKHVNKKISAIKKYVSQQNKPYADELAIRSHLLTRGCQIGTKYAEAFEVLRMKF